MTFAKHVIAASVKGILTGGTDFTLNVIRSTVTLDEYSVPYVKGTLVCSIPALTTLDLIDPRLAQRVAVTLTTTQTGVATVSRPMNLALTDRALDFTAMTMTLSIASDEAILDNFGLIAAAPARTYGLSVKTAVAYALTQIGATLAAGAADYTLTSKTLDPVYTNLIINPNAATSTTMTSGGTNGTLARATGLTGGPVTGITTYTHTTWSGSGGANQAAAIVQTFPAVTAGQQYTVGCWVRANISVPVSLAAQTSAGASITSGSTVTLVATTWTWLSTTFTVPSGATAAAGFVSINNGLQFVSGNTFDTLGWVMVQGTTVPQTFDGSNLGGRDSGLYAVTWTGTANASTSTLTELAQNDGTIWQPGTSAYDWVAPLVQTGGLRLWCDETRVWHLDTSSTVNSTFLSLAGGTNVTDAQETISLTSGEWYTGAVVQYNWTDTAGLSHIQYDTAGVALNGRTLEVTYDDTPYPGAGAAAAILTRASNKGRQFSVTAMPNFAATPTGALLINLPNDDIQSGITSAVTWNLPAEGDANMSVTSRGLVTIPAHSWITIAETTWASIPETTWATVA